jgi:hypothetical protein
MRMRWPRTTVRTRECRTQWSSTWAALSTGEQLLPFIVLSIGCNLSLLLQDQVMAAGCWLGLGCATVGACLLGIALALPCLAALAIPTVLAIFLTARDATPCLAMVVLLLVTVCA